MIVEAFVNMLSTLVGWLFGLLGNSPAPGWLGNLAGNLASLVDLGSSMGVWVPWGVMGSVIAALIVCSGIALVVRIVRIVISLFTGGGGSAA